MANMKTRFNTQFKNWIFISSPLSSIKGFTLLRLVITVYASNTTSNSFYTSNE